MYGSSAGYKRVKQVIYADFLLLLHCRNLQYRLRRGQRISSAREKYPLMLLVGYEVKHCLRYLLPCIYLLLISRILSFTGLSSSGLLLLSALSMPSRLQRFGFHFSVWKRTLKVRSSVHSGKKGYFGSFDGNVLTKRLRKGLLWLFY
jgi:hypothetical protein